MNKKTEAEMMALSLDVMKKSKSEKRKDGKENPLVGAVILFPDGRVDSACRGEFRNGDHAEYTLLDKKHRTDDVSGATCL